MAADPSLAEPWSSVGDRLRGRGLRWTPQRRTVIEVLAGVDGHVSGAELVERCRARDSSTIPSTVYRTLDVLEELGIVSHSHGRGGRQEFHVNRAADHGHLLCSSCGRTWELAPTEVASLAEGLHSARGFRVDVDHLTIEGLCATCLTSNS